MKTKMAVVLLVLLSSAFFAAAQGAEMVTVAVPFPFYVGSKLLPAGSYRIQATDNLREVAIRSVDGKNAAFGEVITQISSSMEDKSSVVFDVKGNDHYLSEIYMQEEDGFLVMGAKGAHTHLRIKGQK